ncbi:MAG: glycoside hydrolase family 2 protein, partial [Bacteroidaceae bacterium]
MAGPIKIVNLDDCKWEFKQVGKGEWMSAKVPGTVHQDLIDHDLLPDPFYGLNENKVQWVENEDWAYRTSFNITDNEMNYQGAILNFEGVDTYADIYLNGALIKRTDNMFVGYTIPVKDFLRKEENNLQILFHSPIKMTLPQLETQGFQYPADNDHSENKVSVYSRKAPYSYGWDWGIRLVTSGLWRPVTLTFFDNAFIDDMYVRQESVTEKVAKLDNILTINSLADDNAVVKLECSYKSEPALTVQKEIKLQKGENTISLPLVINNPHLWWPNGWGEAALYDCVATISVNGKEVALKKERIGLRTIEVVLDDDKDGKSFFFRVNGKPMFAKGANYIPDDALLPNITEDRIKRMFADVKDANMNLIRVWGGGVYESDLFYKYADENGIVLWQDFIFGCTSYPSDPTFMKRVEEEAYYNIRRLRNHASLGMWCGNNEILEGLRYWGWEKKYSDPSIMKEMFEGYDKLFRQLLPAKVKELDPGRFYMHGSPYEANWGIPESWKIADSHNWGVWYGRKPFEAFDKEVGRFMSEYGFQSFPEMKTISTFAAEKDYQIESDVMNGHQKASIGNELIDKTMRIYYNVPEKFEDFVYVGQVLQGKGMRRGFEAHRRNMPYCMGTLYWQLNDSWPVVSWSSIDYYGNWKAMHYEAKRAFAPIIINAIKEGDDLNFYIISDRLEDNDNVTLELKTIDFTGKVLAKEIVKGNIK